MEFVQWLLLVLQASFSHSLAFPVDRLNPLSLFSQSLDDSTDFVFNGKTKTSSPNRIAIIGTGITGATAAFTIAENGRLSRGGPPQITIFERNPIIGGRITTTQVFNDPGLTIDTCAATFIPINDFCLSRFAMNTGLTTQPFTPTQAGVGIWDGEQFQGLIEDQGFRDPQTWTLARKLRWFRRYGNAPFQFDTTVTNQQASFQQLGRSTFASLDREVKDQDLEKLIKLGVCENGFLNCTDAKEKKFLQEIVDAGLRERFFGNFDELNGLDAVLGLGTENVAFIAGGQLRLIDRLVKLSGASLLLNTSVEKLTQNRQEGWNIEYVQAGRQGGAKFDAVIIAAPFVLSNLTIDPAPSQQIPVLSYRDAFVTHFTTPNRLNASFFNISDPAPQNILTINSTGGHSPPFFSLLLIDQTVANPSNGRIENLYKIVSELEIPDSELAKYIEQDDSLTEPTITWFNQEPLPQSVPLYNRNQTILDSIEIAPKLFYAGGGEQITGTVEFGCRMGSNAAHLLLPAPPVGGQTS